MEKHCEKRNMKVGYILKYYPKLSETFVNEEIYQLIKCGKQVNIYSLIDCNRETKHNKVKFVLSKSNLRSYSNNFKGLFSNLFNYPRLVFVIPELFIRTNIKKLIEDIKADSIQHLHTHFIWERAELVAFIAQKLNIPFTVTCHAKDIYVPNMGRILKISRFAKKIITISDYNKNLLISYGVSPEQIEVIHCGVDTTDFRLIKKNKNPKLSILGVGRLVEKKGFIHLLQAAKLLVDENFTRFHIDLIGEGPLKIKLEYYIKKNKLQNYVTLHGSKIDQDVKLFLSNCDVFVLPCVIVNNGDMDGIPVSLMEAIAMGKPVISTNVSGIPELVKNGENGYLVNQRDTKSLKNKLKNFSWKKKIRLGSDFISRNEVKKLVQIISGQM